MDQSFIENADYIIVGAGSAGCVLAARLSEDPSVKVVLIEAGGRDSSPMIKLPVGYAKTLGDPRFDWCYLAGPEPGLGGRNIHYARGKVLGGSSSINGLVWARGARADYDHWADLGAAGWDWDSVLPYFMRAENFVQGKAGRGQGGAVNIHINPGFHEPSVKLIEAGKQAGLPFLADYNIDAPLGLGRAQLNWYRGRRVSAAAAYLDPARSRPNLRIMTGSNADAIEFENGAATGVRIQTSDGIKTLRATHEVLLCAGAFGSPLLLEKSGVGNAARLARLGIPVLTESHELGENLRDHWMVTLNYRLAGLRSINEGSSGWRLLASALRYGLFRTGQMSGTPTEVLGYAKVGPGEGPADIQLFGAPVTFSMGTTPAGKVKINIDKLPGMSFSFYQCHPNSKGHVHMAGRKGEVSIVSNYLTEAEDCEIIVSGMRLCREVMSRPAISPYIESEIGPGRAQQSDEALLDYARATGSSGYHAVGTCRMGGDAHAVVDPKLQLRGVRRLRVVDASIMPNIVGANTHAPTVMIAERAADFCKAAYK